MTYIVGIKHGGSASILADMAATSICGARRDVHKTALKTGRLFDGCIYGCSGSDGAIRSFFHRVRARLTPGMGTVERLAILTTTEPEAQSGEHFEVLFCVRGTDGSKFHVLSSKSGWSLGGDGVSLGSGKDLLDEPLAHFTATRAKDVARRFRESGLVEEIMPFVYALSLSRYSMGEEVSTLEEVGVGGLFHFWTQDEAGERPQAPAIYVFTDVYEEGKYKGVHCFPYRVSFVGDGLVVEDQRERSMEWFLDTHTNSRTAVESAVEWREMLEKERDREAERCWYRFHGCDYIRGALRSNFGCHVSDGSKFCVSRDWVWNQRWLDEIKRNALLASGHQPGPDWPPPLGDEFG